MKYKVVTGTNVEDLINQVNEFIKKGYKPVGDLKIMSNKKNSDKWGNNIFDIYLFQVMIRDDDIDESDWNTKPINKKLWHEQLYGYRKIKMNYVE